MQVFFCLKARYKRKDTFIHVHLCQIFWAVQEGTLFCTIVVWLILLLPPSPQLSDQFSNACLLFLLLLFQIRPKYSVWACKCQGICTWQITDLARDGMGGNAQLILQSMRSGTGGAAAKGPSQPCQPSKVLFTAFVPRQSLENDGGKEGGSPAFWWQTVKWWPGLGWQHCPFHAGIFQGSGMELAFPALLMLNP